MFRPSISILSISLSPASFGQRLAQHVWASHWTRVPMFKQVFAAPPGLWSISYDDPTLTLNKDRFQMSVFCVFSQFWTLVQTFTLRLSDFEMKTWNFIVVFKGIHLIFYSVWHTHTLIPSSALLYNLSALLPAINTFYGLFSKSSSFEWGQPSDAERGCELLGEATDTDI